MFFKLILKIVGRFIGIGNDGKVVSCCRNNNVGSIWIEFVENGFISTADSKA
jgi:hypothetical protein